MSLEKKSKPAKHIVLSKEELDVYNKFKSLAHYDPATDENTYGEYNIQLKAWCDAIRKKHKMDVGDAFSFTETKTPPKRGLF